MKYTASVEEYDNLSFDDKCGVRNVVQESTRQVQAELQIVAINDKERPEVGYVTATDDLINGHVSTWQCLSLELSYSHRHSPENNIP